MTSRLRLVITFCAGVAVGVMLYAYTPKIIRTADLHPPPNLITITQRIDTSGQPTAEQLKALKAAGYDLVINLAPPYSTGSIENEGSLVAAAGITYINIPVDWDYPKMSDFDLFTDILDQAGERHVLVHCQVNRRASMFTFLYRVAHENADVDQAYENVTAIWSPEPHWLEFANTVMSRHQIDFNPL
jgi:protein tyrosine phosphatase (PTP) superfamily phosphohydrolase (DUF442 family)